MLVNNPLSVVNSIALAFGYIVMVGLFLSAVWLLSVLLESWYHNRTKSRKDELEWDIVRADWLLEDLQEQDRIDTEESCSIYPNRTDTNVFDTVTPEDIINYQKEH